VKMANRLCISMLPWGGQGRPWLDACGMASLPGLLEKSSSMKSSAQRWCASRTSRAASSFWSLGASS